LNRTYNIYQMRFIYLFLVSQIFAVKVFDLHISFLW